MDGWTHAPASGRAAAGQGITYHALVCGMPDATRLAGRAGSFLQPQVAPDGPTGPAPQAGGGGWGGVRALSDG